MESVQHVAYPLINDTALVLLAFTVLLGVYVTYLSRPSPLVHPLLLGRQSELSATREKGHSAVYRSFATGHGPPLAVRPATSLKTVANVLDPSCPARFVYSQKLSNDLLKLRATNLAKGLSDVFHLDHASSGKGGILNLLPDGLDSLLLTLAFAVRPVPHHSLLTIPVPHLLAHVLDLATPPSIIVLPARLARPVLEQLIDEETAGSNSNSTVSSLVIVGEDEEVKDVYELAQENGVGAVSWREIEALGDASLIGPGKEVGENEVLITRFWENSEGKVQQSSITHQALTAGIAGLLSLFPAHKRPSPTSKDVVASCIPLNEPVGLSLALASLWSGTGFGTFGAVAGWDSVADEIDPDLDPSTSPSMEMRSLMSPKVDPPTILFLRTPHLAALNASLVDAGRFKPLYPIAKHQKLAGLSEGYVSRDGLMEKYFWGPRVRGPAMGGLAQAVRAVVVVDGKLTPSLLQSARVHLSTPITNLTTSALSTTPVFLTHFHDFQSFPSSAPPSMPKREFTFVPKSSANYDPSKSVEVTDKPPTEADVGVLEEGVTHTGAPAVNVEVVLRGVVDELVEEGGEDAQGEVWMRGPGVLGNGWTRTGLQAQALKNGTFQLH